MTDSTQNIAAFSKYLGYAVGGSEKSLLGYLEKESTAADAKVKILFCKDVKSFGAQRLAQTFNDRFQLVPFNSTCSLPGLYFIEYLINHSCITKVFAGLDDDILFAQGLWAPAALNAFRGKKVRFIRDEFDLGVWANYHSGITKWLKYGFQIIQLPAFLKYQKDNLKSLRESDEIIANSHYMAAEVFRLVGRKATVRYPDIDLDSLRSRYQSLTASVPAGEKAIVMSGNERIKGIETLRWLAGQFSKQRFMVFSRTVSNPEDCRNIRFMPWVRDSAEMFKWAKVVLMPSICNEGFGRVAFEAKALGIPVLVSNRGGLPEAVGNDETCIASTFDEWRSKLSRFVKK